MAVESPVHPGQTPSRKTAKGISGRAIALGTAAVIGTAAVGGLAYETLNSNKTGPEPKPSTPAGVVLQSETPKPINTENPGASISSASEIPLPAWVSKIPPQTITPDKIKLSEQAQAYIKNGVGGINMMAVDIGLGYIVTAQGETLIKAIPTTDGTGILACATTGGDRFTKKALGETTFQGKKIELDQLMGSVCFLFEDSVTVQTPKGAVQGLDALAPFLKQGIDFTAIAQGRIPPEKLTIIENGIKELQAKTGSSNDLNSMVENPIVIWANTFIPNV